MKSDVETIDPTRVKIAVEVPFDELKPSLDHAYKHIGEQIQVPGFRKGHIPAQIVRQRVGLGAIVEHAVNDAMPEFYQRALQENEIRPLGQPELDVTQVPTDDEPEASLMFTIETDIRPEVTLPELDSISVTVESTVVDDDDVEERLTSLRERFGSLLPVDRPAQDGDFLALDLKASLDGEEVDSVSGVSYQVGSGNMLDGLDEAVVGLSAGETTTFEAPLAGGEHAGQASVVTVTVESVKERQLPEADDDFAQLASEFDTLDELRDDLREQVGRAKTSNQAIEARNRLVDALVEQVEIPVPERVIEAEVTRHLEGEGREGDEEHGAEVRVDAERSLRTQLIADALVDALGVSVNQNELVEYLVSTAGQYGMDPNTFIQQVDSQGQIPQMVGEVARSKAFAVALRQVTVTDESGEVVDLSNFIGSDEEDALAAAAAAAQAAAAEQDDTSEDDADRPEDDPAAINI